MATAPASRRLNLTRDQLSAFLTDQQQIRQFELLFSTVDTLQVITGTDFEFQADNAAATANEALAQINALAQVVDLNSPAEALSYLAEISKRIQTLESAPPFSAPPAVTPASPSTSVQFNNAGAFGGSANFTYVTGTNTLTVGPAGTTATVIETLAPTGATVAGTLRIRGKNASATNGAGGPLNFVGGNGLGTGAGGLLAFNSGTGSNGGLIQFVSGNGTSSGGNIVFASGAGTNSSGGIFQMSAGNGNAGAASGGSFDLSAGNAVVSGVGGGFALLAGASLGGGAGGDIQITSGFGAPSGNVFIGSDGNPACLTVTENGVGVSQMGFFNAVPVARPAAVPVTAAGIHAALVSLGLIT